MRLRKIVSILPISEIGNLIIKMPKWPILKYLVKMIHEKIWNLGKQSFGPTMSGKDTNSQRQTNVISFITVVPTLGEGHFPKKCQFPILKIGILSSIWLFYEKIPKLIFDKKGLFLLSWVGNTVLQLEFFDNNQKFFGLGGQWGPKYKFVSYPVCEVANSYHQASKVLQFHLAVHTK